MRTFPIEHPVSIKNVGLTKYVTHTVESIPHAREIADQICTESMLPVYFGSGYAVDRAHIVRLDWGSEIVLRFYTNGEDRSGLVDDYTTVHSFRVA